MPRFDVGALMKSRKKLKEDLISQNEEIKDVRREIDFKESELRGKKEKIRRLNEKVDSLVAEREELESIEAELSPREVAKGQYLPMRAVNARKKLPTGVNLKSTTSRKRRRETFEAATEINGSQEGASYGLVDTVDKSVKADRIVEVIEKAKCKNIKSKVLPNIYKKSLVKFENSENNMLRSVAMYYSRGVMGKKKYHAVRRANSFKSIKNHKGKRVASRLSISWCPIPKLVPYHRLMSFVKDINIGTLYSVREMLCDDLDERQKVDGVYRDLEELLIHISSFYLNNDYDLLDFGDPDTFYVALGGDGAPFGKDDTSVAWLVSILNIGQGVLSSSENFLLFGANCCETSLPVRLFVSQLMEDVMKIERKTYSINLHNGTTRNIKFIVSEFPNDMKMLCFLTGELSNSATYFSSFADVSLESIKSKAVLSGTFGPEPGNTWKPWKYADRIKVAEDVKKYKIKIAKQKLASSTMRTRITTFIAKQHSRQEFEPLIGKSVDKIHVDSLHLKNNACARAHGHFLEELLKQCSRDVYNFASFSKLPPGSKFVIYIETLSSKCSLSRLAKKVIKWFDESKGAKKDSFDYRFTGRDSRMFLHNFMYLIAVLEEGTSGQHFQQRIFGLALICLNLRNAASLFTRINITAEQVSNLKEYCCQYFRANHVFYSANPTVWTLGYVVPVHTQDMLTKYGMGLGLNSMEGREAKHIAIAKFAQNTFYQKRWEQIFRHEYVSLVWLRDKGFDLSGAANRQLTYIPHRVTKPTYCHCGYDKEENQEQCKFCTHPKMKEALVSITNGRWA